MTERTRTRWTPIGRVSIRKTGRYWYARYRLAKAGPRSEISLHVSTREEATKKAQNLNQMLEREEYGRLEERRQGETLTFGQMVDLFQAEYTGWAETTRTKAEGLIKLLKAQWETTPLVTITPRLIQGYLSRRRQRDNLASGTHNRYLSFLRRLFQMAVDYGYLHENPAKPVASPSPAA